MEVIARRERLSTPFGFKGTSIDELWNTVCVLGEHAAVSVQSPVWADARVVSALGYEAANEAMLRCTEEGLRLLAGLPATRHPYDNLTALLPAVVKRSQRETGLADVSPNVALNALVAVDVVSWAQYGDLAEIESLGPRHEVRELRTLGFGSTPDEVAAAVAVNPLVKVKIGAPADDVAAMVATDVATLRAVDRVARDHGRPTYYLDANGRYPDRAAVERFLDGSGLADRVVLLEDPCPPSVDLTGLGVVVAADEPVHDRASLERAAARGYTAVALKPAAKTPSVTLRLARDVLELGLAGFVADLTTHPHLAVWNRLFAERLPALPGVEPFVEANGGQHYADWAAMTADWAATEGADLLTRGSAYARRRLGR